MHGNPIKTLISICIHPISMVSACFLMYSIDFCLFSHVLHCFRLFCSVSICFALFHMFFFIIWYVLHVFNYFYIVSVILLKIVPELSRRRPGGVPEASRRRPGGVPEPLFCPVFHVLFKFYKKTLFCLCFSCFFSFLHHLLMQCHTFCLFLVLFGCFVWYFIFL